MFSWLGLLVLKLLKSALLGTVGNFFHQMLETVAVGLGTRIVALFIPSKTDPRIIPSSQAPVTDAKGAPAIPPASPNFELRQHATTKRLIASLKSKFYWTAGIFGLVMFCSLLMIGWAAHGKYQSRIDGLDKRIGDCRNIVSGKLRTEGDWSVECTKHRAEKKEMIGTWYYLVWMFWEMKANLYTCGLVNCTGFLQGLSYAAYTGFLTVFVYAVAIGVVFAGLMLFHDYASSPPSPPPSKPGAASAAAVAVLAQSTEDVIVT